MIAARVNSRWSPGQTATEFACVASAFLLFLTAVMMMGEAVMAYNSMSSAAEEAVRYAVAYGPNSPSPASQTTIEQVAVNVAPQLHLTATSGSTTGNVTSSWVTDANISTREDAKVVITYSYVLKIPFMNSVTLHLTATSQMMAAQ
jgi:Flp pilus assembly protein TadG